MASVALFQKPTTRYSSIQSNNLWIKDEIHPSPSQTLSSSTIGMMTDKFDISLLKDLSLTTPDIIPIAKMPICVNRQHPPLHINGQQQQPFHVTKSNDANKVIQDINAIDKTKSPKTLTDPLEDTLKAVDARRKYPISEDSDDMPCYYSSETEEQTLLAPLPPSFDSADNDSFLDDISCEELKTKLLDITRSNDESLSTQKVVDTVNQPQQETVPSESLPSASSLLDEFDLEDIDILPPLPPPPDEAKREQKQQHQIETTPYIRKNEINIYKDVLCARGGEGNNNPGNISYLYEIKKARPAYRLLDERTEKKQKKEMSLGIIEKIKSKGGRFLRKNDNHDNLWHVLDDTPLLRKVSQALRDKTPDEKKEKNSINNVSKKTKPTEGNRAKKKRKPTRQQCRNDTKARKSMRLCE